MVRLHNEPVLDTSIGGTGRATAFGRQGIEGSHNDVLLGVTINGEAKFFGFTGALVTVVVMAVMTFRSRGKGSGGQEAQAKEGDVQFHGGDIFRFVEK